MTLPPHRPPSHVVAAIHTTEGAGFEVFRPFPRPDFDLFDPFLLLDEMGPSEYAPGQAKGAPDHPHRGFETVTYLLDGEFEHADSFGNRGVIQPGGVQWMTAGSGVVHSEMPSAAFQRSGGRLHGLQLWVNLPAEHKMIAPRYQGLRRQDIPEVDIEGGAVRVISGEFAGTTGAGETVSPITYLHVRLEPATPLTVDVDPLHNAALYVLEGEVSVGAERAGAHHLVAWPAQSGAVHFEAGPTGLDAIVLTGRPLNEPVARYGPFVMNTRDEIVGAVEDYQAGRMGAIAPTGIA